MKNLFKRIKEHFTKNLICNETPVELRMEPCYGNRYMMLMYRPMVDGYSLIDKVRCGGRDWRPIFQFFNGDEAIDGGLWCEITHDYYKEDIATLLEAYKNTFKTMGDVWTYTSAEEQRKAEYEDRREAYMRKVDRMFY